MIGKIRTDTALMLRKHTDIIPSSEHRISIIHKYAIDNEIFMVSYYGIYHNIKSLSFTYNGTCKRYCRSYIEINTRAGLLIQSLYVPVEIPVLMYDKIARHIKNKYSRLYYYLIELTREYNSKVVINVGSIITNDNPPLHLELSVSFTDIYTYTYSVNREDLQYMASSTVGFLTRDKEYIDIDISVNKIYNKLHSEGVEVAHSDIKEAIETIFDVLGDEELLFLSLKSMIYSIPMILLQ